MLSVSAIWARDMPHICIEARIEAAKQLCSDVALFADYIDLCGHHQGLSRKQLGYRTPEELFEAELDRIFAT